MFESLSDTQREIVFNKSGRFIVRACPGSGKTYCVSARLARLISEWKENYTGIAAVSFTNVAWKEIEKKYRQKSTGNRSISFPHFIGTLDSFINQYIFLPLGHLVMKCGKRPTLVGEPHGSWTLRHYERDPQQYFDKCSFDINGELIRLAPPQSFGFSWKRNKNGEVNGHVKNLLASKKALILDGYANQSDANYIAMRILEQYPSICQAIAIRFPNLIIDEAQDTSEVQMRIIDLLAAGGLNEMMLVGDPDQAIFEWNGARPELFSEKIAQWGNVVYLNENRRSSQEICKSTFHFSSLPFASNSVSGEVKDFAFVPTVITYNNNLPQTVEGFLQTCIENEIEVSDKTVAVLYRSKGMINEIVGVQRVPFGSNHWDPQNKFTQDFVRGKYLFDQGDFKNGFKLIEKAIIKMKNNTAVCSDEMIEKTIEAEGFIKYRSIVSDFIQLLPNTNMTLGEWINATNADFASRNIVHTLEINPESADYSFSQVFLNEDELATEANYRIGTVHSVKGETFDATLLILKERAGQSGKYRNLMVNTYPLSENEELRIAYVGMTRPRKILAIAVPSEECRVAWQNRLSQIHQILQ
jgi:Superfamily I DNA and RNA helicases